MATTTHAEPALVINGKLYVVVESEVNGGIKWQALVGPKGGRFLLATYSSGKRELMTMTMRTIYRG